MSPFGVKEIVVVGAGELWASRSDFQGTVGNVGNPADRVRRSSLSAGVFHVSHSDISIGRSWGHHHWATTIQEKTGSTMFESEFQIEILSNVLPTVILAAV